MAILAEYHRPQTLSQALELLAEPRSRRLPLAGGTHLVPALETRQRRDVDGVVDLADLDLSFIEREGHHLRVGAMTTLTDFVQHPDCVAIAGGILPRTARFEGPQNLCNAATVGGLIALAEPDSELSAALLALDATIVAVSGNGIETVRTFEDFIPSRTQWTRRAGLITEIRLPLAQREGGHARIARTPMDRCIVAAVAIQVLNGASSRLPSASTKGVRIGLCGVGTRPLLSGRALNPPDDFKGGVEYRLTMSRYRAGAGARLYVSRSAVVGLNSLLTTDQGL